jgi:hypothetical protein
MAAQKGKPSGRGTTDNSEAMAKEAVTVAEKHIGGPATQKNKYGAMDSPDDGQDSALAARGMSSSSAAKAWKKTGFKVPKTETEDHAPKRAGSR